MLSENGILSLSLIPFRSKVAFISDLESNLLSVATIWPLNAVLLQSTSRLSHLPFSDTYYSSLVAVCLQRVDWDYSFKISGEF